MVDHYCPHYCPTIAPTIVVLLVGPFDDRYYYAIVDRYIEVTVVVLPWPVAALYRTAPEDW